MTRYFDIAPAPSRADTPAGASRRRRRSDAGVIDMRRADSFPAWRSSVTLGASARHQVLFHARSSHFHSTLTTRSRSDVARADGIGRSALAGERASARSFSWLS